MDINPQPIDTNLGEPVVEITPDPENPQNEDSTKIVVKQQREVVLKDTTIGQLKSDIAVLEDEKSVRQSQVDKLLSEIASKQKEIDAKQLELNDFINQVKAKVG